VKTIQKSLVLMGVASALATLPLASVGAAEAARGCFASEASLNGPNDVDVALEAFGGNLVAVGRVDSVTSGGEIEVLGFRVQAVSGDSFQVGDFALVLDWASVLQSAGTYEVRRLNSRYVPGVSEVYLRSRVDQAIGTLAQLRIGGIRVNYASTELLQSAPSLQSSVVAVRGTQPHPRGEILGVCAVALGSLGTGSPTAMGSMGTGGPTAMGSMGTGGPTAMGSMGTGGPTAMGSMGTGGPTAMGSMGTGGPTAMGSMGTGGPTAMGSMGTGGPNGN
jgi:hypothetical protein